MAHRDGRAWNIGENRRLGKPSYPETFFKKVIENNFDDRCYDTEKYMNGFWLDFSWPHKRLCIEIDGKQHKENPDQAARDQRKDTMLAENGWKVLRIEWKTLFHNTKETIQLAKNFIDGSVAQRQSSRPLTDVSGFQNSPDPPNF